MKKNSILVFHPIIAPYRIDFFNALAAHFDATICLFWRNLKDQAFNYAKIKEQFQFTPEYIVRDEMGSRKWLVALWKQLKMGNPVIVLVNEFGLCTILTILHRMLTKKKYKIVSIVDDSYNMVVGNNQFTWRHKKAMELLMPYIDEVINVEPRVTEWYQKHFNKGIYFPIICDDDIARKRLERVLPFSEKYVKEYKLEGKKILLFVGRLVAFKNIAFAIKAFLEAAIPDSVLVIVGDGDEREQLRNLADVHENIILTGRFEGDELYAWYNVGQVFTLPSILEPFGAVTNEALVAGCKALVSKDAGSNCLVKDGVNGFVIDPKNKETYIKALENAFKDITTVTLPLQVKPYMMCEMFKDNINRLVGDLNSL